ncbi:hypothetical protein A3A71_00660 [Candidatus Berkelbacteria bacterium RIFCSPLOWO2_01_FULL_50_28]|uniref:Polysaccharide biosynthesis protein C-terminal domain-containing protein n=1 Tax=Candidatus Berkelbacteria bacterium RIFCSPLOWO2_01_FULL_50_28 TaxID=1797471 RepID=A0A1F5EB12_9BACT|nr:MAG: hypothetical protein A2807_01055 [Candidatus Berkelbacteria bacterium RIFCSPHIGHO2_01_FULL_50_36]OGD62906.1 MAG: hypothetical protein A3F39_04070 [Candidatus Berkelbacteria bacterium RIFCSPHIGHO2_12_FULL_50_11]OGD64553.1 MAG: hypothetical protein A3A71_00660 [Candidatus Berkelbacteria bacterium RIFCSPLOWO2_01_FULL_50_28]
MKGVAARLVGRIYALVFGEKMSGEAKDFTKNLGIVSIGYGVSLVLGFVFQVLLGRVLGPDQYGRFSLVNSVALFLYIPMSLGLSTALTKYNAEQTSDGERKKYISSAILIFFAASLVSILLYIAFREGFLRIFNVPSLVFYLAIAYAFLYTLDSLTKGGLRSLNMFKQLSYLYALYGIAGLVGLLILIQFNLISFTSAIYTVFAAFGIVIIGSFINLRRYFSPTSFSPPFAKNLLMYGAAGILGGIASTFLVQTGKLLINGYLTVGEVGIYSAYYASSINIAFILNAVFISVFFPTAAKFSTRQPIFSKIKRLSPFLYGTVIPGLFIVQLIILKIYGASYPIELPLILAFSVAGALIIHYTLYIWTFASEGLRGIRTSNLITVFIAGINLLFGFLLIPRLHIMGAVLAFILAYAVGVMISTIMKNRFA